MTRLSVMDFLITCRPFSCPSACRLDVENDFLHFARKANGFQSRVGKVDDSTAVTADVHAGVSRKRMGTV